MKQESEAIIAAIFDIVRDKGRNLMATDMEEINALSMKLDNADLAEAWPWVEEGLALVINAPDYEGDIAPFE